MSALRDKSFDAKELIASAQGYSRRSASASVNYAALENVKASDPKDRMQTTYSNAGTLRR